MPLSDDVIDGTKRVGSAIGKGALFFGIAFVVAAAVFFLAPVVVGGVFTLAGMGGAAGAAGQILGAGLLGAAIGGIGLGILSVFPSIKGFFKDNSQQASGYQENSTALSNGRAPELEQDMNPYAKGGHSAALMQRYNENSQNASIQR